MIRPIPATRRNAIVAAVRLSVLLLSALCLSVMVSVAARQSAPPVASVAHSPTPPSEAVTASHVPVHALPDSYSPTVAVLPVAALRIYCGNARGVEWQLVGTPDGSVTGYARVSDAQCSTD